MSMNISIRKERRERSYTYSLRVGWKLCLLIGVRSTYELLHMLKFMVTFNSCFTMGKGHKLVMDVSKGFGGPQY